MWQSGLVEHDRRGAWAYFRGKRHRIGLQRQVLTLRADDIEFIMIARRSVRHEQFPIANAADAHRMPPRIPEIEIADHTDPPCIGGEHHEGHAADTVQRHGTRAKLVVNPLMGAFASRYRSKSLKTGGKR